MLDFISNDPTGHVDDFTITLNDLVVYREELKQFGVFKTTTIFGHQIYDIESGNGTPEQMIEASRVVFLNAATKWRDGLDRPTFEWSNRVPHDWSDCNGPERYIYSVNGAELGDINETNHKKPKFLVTLGNMQQTVAQLDMAKALLEEYAHKWVLEVAGRVSIKTEDLPQSIIDELSKPIENYPHVALDEDDDLDYDSLPNPFVDSEGSSPALPEETVDDSFKMPYYFTGTSDLSPNSPDAGYHLLYIKKGVIGEPSKIIEEAKEFEDAILQDVKIMALVELSDLMGAIILYLKKHHPNITMDDLLKMSEVTQRAFRNGKRT